MKNINPPKTSQAHKVCEEQCHHKTQLFQKNYLYKALKALLLEISLLKHLRVHFRFVGYMEGHFIYDIHFYKSFIICVNIPIFSDLLTR